MDRVVINIPGRTALQLYNSNESFIQQTLINGGTGPAGNMTVAPAVTRDPNGYYVMPPRGVALNFITAGNSGLKITVSGYNVNGVLQSELLTIVSNVSNTTLYADYVRITSIVAASAYTAITCTNFYPFKLYGEESYKPITLDGYQGTITIAGAVASSRVVYFEGYDSLGNFISEYGLLPNIAQTFTTVNSYWKVNRVAVFYGAVPSSELFTITVTPTSTIWVPFNTNSSIFNAAYAAAVTNTIAYKPGYTLSKTYQNDGIPVNPSSLFVTYPTTDAGGNTVGVVPAPTGAMKFDFSTYGNTATFQATIIQQGVV